jgi:hypothetical protein
LNGEADCRDISYLKAELEELFSISYRFEKAEHIRGTAPA